MTDHTFPASPGVTPRRRLIDAVRDYFAGGVGVLPALLLVVLVGAAVFAPLIAPQNPYDLTQLDIMEGTLPPGSPAYAGFTFMLGSDDQGRDMLSAILYGLRVSLFVGALSTIIAGSLGAAIGVAAAYAGGKIEGFIMRVVDLQLSLPTVLIALILMSVFGRGVDKVILALVLVQWAYYARTVRGSALVEVGKDYIQAARCLGLPRWRIVFRHLLPNCLPPLIVVGTVQVAQSISLEAALSFLGVGVPVTEPSLGLLIKNGYDYLLSGNYWISTYPGVALLLAIVAINLVGDRLRDYLNPRLAR